MRDAYLPDVEALQAEFLPKIEHHLLQPQSPELLIAQEGALASFYAPFDHLNSAARVAIVGLTPGRFQATSALARFRALRLAGLDRIRAMESTKYSVSFGGPMRANLIQMLDFIGLQHWIGIATCGTLFSTHVHLAHHTSLLRYPVFRQVENYSGQPSVGSSPFLRDQISRWFAPELSNLCKALIIPLGAQVEAALADLVKAGAVSPDRVLAGLPHPSGANAERIAYFLGRKKKAELSRQTRPEPLDAARERLTAQLAAAAP